MLNDSRIGGIHDTLAYIDNLMDKNRIDIKIDQCLYIMINLKVCILILLVNAKMINCQMKKNDYEKGNFNYFIMWGYGIGDDCL